MWCGHLVHVAIPASRGGQSSLAIYPFFNCNWSLYSTPKDNKNHIFNASLYAGQAILTFHSELKQDTYSRYLSDIAHHHLAMRFTSHSSTHVPINN
jgi:photosystem I P700 chlorophyll a apoprotein A2